MKKIHLIVLSLICISGCNSYTVQPDSIQINSLEEASKYHASSASSNIQFAIENYQGAWSDPMEYNPDFVLDKNMNINIGWRTCKAKLIEQKNNILLFECDQKNAGKEIFHYVGTKIFYYTDSDNKTASLKLSITFSHDKNCALKGTTATKECYKENSYDYEYKMYRKK